MFNSFKIKKAVLLTACVLISAAMFSSCGKKEETAVKPAEIQENLTLDAEIRQQDFQCTAQFKRNGSVWECTFKSPESIKGMVVTLSGDQCKVDYSSLNYQLERKNLPEASCISLITKSVDKIILKKDLNCRKGEESDKSEVIYESGSVSGVDFSAQIKDGKISSLNFPESLSVLF